MSDSSDSKTIANLDLLRAVAVLLVFGSHVRIISLPKGPSMFANYGQLGVYFFFVHTTLVLLLSIERLPKTSSFWVNYIAFMLRRVFRIYPLSIVFIFITFSFHLPAKGFVFGNVTTAEPFGTFDLIANLALVQNLVHRADLIGVLWSLPVEVQMYLLLPHLFLFSWHFKGLAPAVVLWTLAVIVGAFAPHVSSRLDILSFAPCFLGGVISYSQLRFGRRMQLWPWFWPLFLLMLMVLMALCPWQWRLQGGWAVCLLLGLSLPHFLESRSVVLRRASHIIAKYSYGIYLSHTFAIWIALVMLRDTPGYIRWPTLFASLAILSVASFHLIENPMIHVSAMLAGRCLRRAGDLTRRQCKESLQLP